MSLKVKEKALSVESLIGENSAQTVVQGTLELPAKLNNIERVIWLTGEANITDSKVVEDRVLIEGYINMQLVYLTEGNEEQSSIYERVSWSKAIPFNSFVEIIGIDDGMISQSKCQVLNIDWELRPDQRTFDVDVLTLFNASVVEKQEESVLVSASIPPPTKLSVEDIPVNTMVVLDTIKQEEFVSFTWESPGDNLAIEKVLYLKVNPILTENQIAENKIKLFGQFDIEMIYVTEDMELKHLDQENVMPFELNVPSDLSSQEINVVSDFVVDTGYQIVEEGLQFDLNLIADIQLVEDVQTKVVLRIDSSSEKTVEVRKKAIKFDNIVNEKSQQSSAQGMLELFDDNPPIREIILAKGEALVSEYRIDEDKVFIDGSVVIELVYLAHTDDEQKLLYYVKFPNALDIQQVIALGGVEPGMRADIDLEVKKIKPDLINRETMEVDVVFKVNIKVSQSIEEEVIVEALEVQPPDPNPPSITYVAVNSKDTLWKLAKKYHTNVDSILDANSWLREREDKKLAVNDKVCIPRK